MQESKRKEYLIYCASFVVALSGMIYELLWAQTISFFVANNIFWLSVVIGLYLMSFGLGVGVVSINSWNKEKAEWPSFLRMKIFSALIGGFGVSAIYIGHMIFSFFWEQSSPGGFVAFYLIFLTLVMSIGFLSGIQISLLIKLGDGLSEDKRMPSRVWTAASVGSLAGAAGFSLILLPRFEWIAVGFLIASINMIMAFYLSAVYVKKDPIRISTSRLSIGIGFLGLLFIVGLLESQSVQQYFLKKYYDRLSFKDLKTLFSPVSQMPDIERESSLYQTMDLVYDPLSHAPLPPDIVTNYSSKFSLHPEYPKGYKLFLNGDFRWSSSYDEIYHEYFVHVPIIMNRSIPRQVLVLGGGDGLLVKELLKYPQVKGIIQVEPDGKLVEWAKTNAVFKQMTKGVFDDPRLHIVISDAFQFMKGCRDRYDAIYVDFSKPTDYNLSRLYSFEFYSLIRRGLKDNGFAVLNAPGIESFDNSEGHGATVMAPGNQWEIYYNTLKAGEFGTIVPYVMNLEPRNQRALLAVYQFWGGKNGYSQARDQNKIIFKDLRTRNVAQAILKKYLADLRKGFIMVQPSRRAYSRKYEQPPVQFYSLNEERFDLAFTLPFKFSSDIDPRQINYLLRPRLFGSEPWYLPKLP